MIRLVKFHINHPNIKQQMFKLRLSTEWYNSVQSGTSGITLWGDKSYITCHPIEFKVNIYAKRIHKSESQPLQKYFTL